MARVDKSVLVRHSAAQMFVLVDDVEHYPEFLPWCGGTAVKFRDEHTTLATIHINYHHIKQSFTTENSKQAPALMEIRLREGPFRQLEGQWRFTALGEEACKIEFSLQYEFASRLLDGVLGPVFNYIASTFVDAFVQRADRIYR
ncbi:MAG: type II toxin-antitoxin system RatA family toxin [Betaproteobacteria bacterium]|nr:type II toxin-antitoxin system RatA family toxin [Betaproteobacteria bacterium]